MAWPSNRHMDKSTAEGAPNSYHGSTACSESNVAVGIPKSAFTEDMIMLLNFL